jgi:hypothetical protein
MHTYSNRKRMRRNSAEIFLSAVVAILIFLAISAAAQEIVLPPKPPAPSEYGKVVLDTYAAKSPGAVVFDHWLHRSRFTCRVCHVDIGFAMEAKATGVIARGSTAAPAMTVSAYSTANLSSPPAPRHLRRPCAAAATPRAKWVSASTSTTRSPRISRRTSTASTGKRRRRVASSNRWMFWKASAFGGRRWRTGKTLPSRQIWSGFTP